GRAALGHRAQRGGVAEHFAQRHHRVDHLARRAVVRALQDAATTAQVAHHVTHVVLGGHDLDLHDRLQEHRAGLLEAFLEGHRTGDLERHFVRVDVVERAVDGADLDVNHREAGQDAILHGLLDALARGRDVLLRHDAADDGVLVDEATTTLQRLHLDDDVAVLTAAARLADELAFLLDRLADGLAVGNLRLADVGLDVELALQAVNDDVQVQLAHAGDDGLAGLLVGADSEGRVLLGQTAEGDAHLLLVALGLRLDRHRDHRLGEGHPLEGDHVVDVAQGVTGGDILQADGGGDV